MKKLWKAKAKPIEIQANGEVYTIVFSPDAKHVIGGGQSKSIGKWQVKDGRGVGAMEVTRYLLNVAVSKDGRFMACGGSSGLADVWDLETHKKVVEVQIEGGTRVFAVDVSPDSTRIATGTDHYVAVWSISTGQLVLGPLEHANIIAAVKFSPSGDRIATATWEQNSIRLYDSSNGEMLADIPDRVSSPYNTALAWSNDGRQLFIASYTGKIKCFHVSGSFLSWTEWSVQADNQPVCIALASNGKFIASASSRFISFWDTSTHSRIGSIIEHSERVWSMAISNDGHLASGGDDKKITLRNLKITLPRSYFLDPGDLPSRSQSLPQNPIIQQNTCMEEVRRLETLLGEKDKAIDESRKGKDKLEQTILSLSATIRTQEESLDQLKQEMLNLKATVQGLRTQLSDAREAAQKLTKRLDETSEVADQYRLGADHIKTAFDALKAKHEIELSQVQEPALANQETGSKCRNRSIGIDVFNSWMRDHSITAKIAISEETENYSTADYNALACCAFTQAHSRNWSAAYEDAQKSINMQPSTIGHIAKAIALIGQKDYKAAMRAFSLVFRDGNPNENEFMLMIWAVLSCLDGEYIDGILRIHDLTDTDIETRCTVQAYMYILLGDRYMNEGDYERAIQLFNHARASCSPHTSPRLELISLISGWHFDGLERTALQHLREALHAAGRTKDITDTLLQVDK